MKLARHKACVSETEFCAWLSQANPSDALEYHRGFLVVDTDPGGFAFASAERLSLIALAHRARWAFENRLVHLVQYRLGDCRFSYLAIARERPQTPTFSYLLLAEAA